MMLLETEFNRRQIHDTKMTNCKRCGALLQPDMTFCKKCGEPIPQVSKQVSQPHAPKKPQRPQLLKAAGTQPQRPVAPTKPKAPVAPTAPTTKGIFTDAVRSVANAITGGALNEEIAREQQRAVNRQARNDQYEIQQAQDETQQAEQAQIAAEREAERVRDLRSAELVDGIEVVRGKAIWSIHSGDIAHRISENELENVEKLKGIIVQEGCTAIIYANGELVSTLSAGAYLFYKSVEEEKAAIRAAIEEAEKEMTEAEKRERDVKRRSEPTFRELGIVGEIGRGFSWLGRIIFGEKKHEQKEKVKKRRLDYARIIARVTQAPVLSVYIVSNRIINLTFGVAADEKGRPVFKPYTIPMGIQDVEVGVSLQMRVSDIHALATNYLAERHNFNTNLLQQLLTGSIETLLRQQLRNVEYQQTGFDQDVVDFLKEEIRNTINAQVFGLECVTVLNITDSNADFERFRQVERELYNTEKELDFMHRTGEFRNRMEVEANAQQIASAQTTEQLRHALQKVNEDQLLHDDELEEFVLLLESQKRIRTAKTEEEEHEALEDLRKSRLLKQEDMEVLEDALAHKRIPREEITEVMRIQSAQNIDTARLKAEWALGDARTDHDWQREDLERRRNWGIEDEEQERQWMREEKEYNRDFARAQQQDDYDFQQMMRQHELEKEDRLLARNERLEDERLAYERSRQEKMDDDQLDANRHQRQIDKLQAMAQMQAQLDQQKFQHEENVATIQSDEQKNRDNLFANMSAEQIRAAQLSHLTGDAQVAMANAYQGEKESELLRESNKQKEDMMQQMLQMQQQNSNAQMDTMMQMAGMIKDTAASIGGAQQANQQQRIDQLQTENERQQQRMEHTQDRAMDNLAQVSAAAAGNINAFNGGLGGGAATQSQQPQAQTEQPQPIECQCYNCKKTLHIVPGTPQCPECGAPFQW